MNRFNKPKASVFKKIYIARKLNNRNSVSINAFNQYVSIVKSLFVDKSRTEPTTLSMEKLSFFFETFV